MSQPYTKSQLSEKLRRLRKKYRVISTRLSKGLDQSFLTPHDRDLYQLCTRLWHPDYADTSPFGGGSNGKSQKSDLVGVQIPVLTTLSVDSDPKLVEQFKSHHLDDGYAEAGLGGEERLSAVNVEFAGEGAREAKMQNQTGAENSTGEEVLVAKAIIDAFDESLKEVKKGFVNKGGCVTEGMSMLSFQRRWQEQRFAEMEALGRRMRLVFENSLLRRQ